MSVIPQIQPNVKSYWIIVSDEGPSSFPYQHATYESAYEESIRLSKIKPGLKFNIFKFAGYAIAEEPKSSFHTYFEPITNSYWVGYSPKFYTNRQADSSIPF